MQVAATSAVQFSEVLADGTDVHDPLTSVQLVASYPDFDQPTNSDGTPNLVATAQGYHYTIGQTQAPAAAAPFIWTQVNSADAISAGWLRLASDGPHWPAGQVQLTQTLVFDGNDPRVNLTGGGVTWSSTSLTSTNLAPILVASAVGYVYAHFILDRVCYAQHHVDGDPGPRRRHSGARPMGGAGPIGGAYAISGTDSTPGPTR